MPPGRFKHADTTNDVVPRESIELSSKTKGKARAVAAIPFSDADNDNDEYPGPKEALTVISSDCENPNFQGLYKAPLRLFMINRRREPNRIRVVCSRDIEIPWPELDKGVLVEEASGLNFELDDKATTNLSYCNNLTREETSSHRHSDVDYENYIEDDELDYFLDSEDMEEGNNEPSIDDGADYGSGLEDSTKNSEDDIEESFGESKYEDLDLEDQNYRSDDGEYGDNDNTEGIEGYDDDDDDEIAEYL
ncbi:hypothetical protein K435DRAFT_862816 [Dendrothele bispora CBS 962.96]|uniref:Uncharacterized protein n=1 Tax=Dendrothele bispora (strain CBS 962.96) TaxID=1314807 RepID=A0A4S8LS61_DENBC|nr:hypothetical protein K435DRAFT_862816 [Dendrothele bispora CBS 962.96]